MGTDAILLISNSGNLRIVDSMSRNILVSKTIAVTNSPIKAYVGELAYLRNGSNGKIQYYDKTFTTLTDTSLSIDAQVMVHGGGIWYIIQPDADYYWNKYNSALSFISGSTVKYGTHLLSGQFGQVWNNMYIVSSKNSSSGVPSFLMPSISDFSTTGWPSGLTTSNGYIGYKWIGSDGFLYANTQTSTNMWRISKIDMSTKSEVWNFTITDWQVGTPSYYDNKVYVTHCASGSSGMVSVYNASNGAFIASYNTNAVNAYDGFVCGNNYWVSNESDSQCRLHAAYLSNLSIFNTVLNTPTYFSTKPVILPNYSETVNSKISMII